VLLTISPDYSWAYVFVYVNQLGNEIPPGFRTPRITRRLARFSVFSYTSIYNIISIRIDLNPSATVTCASLGVYWVFVESGQILLLRCVVVPHRTNLTENLCSVAHTQISEAGWRRVGCRGREWRVGTAVEAGWPGGLAFRSFFVRFRPWLSDQMLSDQCRPRIIGPTPAGLRQALSDHQRPLYIIGRPASSRISRIFPHSIKSQIFCQYIACIL
jgi:hypothetical protein